MKANSLTFEYEGAKVHYLFYKGGAENLLCFHGYGQQANVFEPLAERLSDRYSLYSFDLFFHGQSFWPDCERPVSTTFMANMIGSFIKLKGISKVNLCGYSLGGKIMLSLTEKISENIQTLLLIAPDGIKTNFWYSMATYPYWMRGLFRYTIRNPKSYFKLSKGLYKVGILDKGVVRFATKQMDTESKRKKVYCTWLTYRKLSPNVNKLAKKINKRNIKVKVYLGVYDKIITEGSVIPFSKKLDNCEITMLMRGHNTLIRDVAYCKERII